MKNTNLRKELERYDAWTVPDYLYDAWRILLAEYNPPNKREILRQAEFDLHEEELTRLQDVFNRDRRQMGERTKLKFNWSSK